MKLFSLRTYSRVYIYATSDSVFAEWSAALRSVGLRNSSIADESRFPDLKNNVLLLLNPDVAQLEQLKNYFGQHTLHLHNLYIVSDDAAWIELAAQFGCHHFNNSTHPLEAARIFNHHTKAVPRNYFARYASLFNF